MSRDSDKLECSVRSRLKALQLSPLKVPAFFAVLTLPFDLLRYETLTTREPITERTVAQIVDEVFLPIVSL